MANISRAQLNEIKKQRQQALKEEQEKALEQGDVTHDEIHAQNQKKDKLGLTSKQRKILRDSIEHETVSVKWNISVGDLVYLPDDTIGMVVKEHSEHQIPKAKAATRKKSIKNINVGRVYVVSFTGNNWFRPGDLKRIAQQA